MQFVGSQCAERTFNNQVHFVAHVLDFVINFRYLVTDNFHPFLDMVRGFEDLHIRHPCLLLRQPIQSAQRVLDISPAN